VEWPTDQATGDAPVVVVGCGGHGREVADVVAAAGGSVLGFVDDAPDRLDRVERRGIPLLGAVSALGSLDARYLAGIGSGAVRRRIDEAATAAGVVAATVVHPQSALGSDLRIEPGFVVCAHASVTTNVTVGRHTHLNRNATIGHDCRIGAYVTVNPGAMVSGSVVLGDEVTIGSGAVVVQGLTVGAGTLVGAGAVVTTDLPPGVVAYGNPARVVRPV
jgi:sugar O-acyltransferase (sialic acid O-acetyltransferase NeuD family)